MPGCTTLKGTASQWPKADLMTDPWRPTQNIRTHTIRSSEKCFHQVLWGDEHESTHRRMKAGYEIIRSMWSGLTQRSNMGHSHESRGERSKRHFKGPLLQAVISQLKIKKTWVMRDHSQKHCHSYMKMKSNSYLQSSVSEPIRSDWRRIWTNYILLTTGHPAQLRMETVSACIEK